MRYVVGLLFICMMQSASAAEVEVKLDRNLIEMDESFTAVFSASASVDGDPDFSPLQKDFRTLTRNQSSSIQIVNGKMSRESTWTLSLMPRGAGKLTIPAIKFGSDSSKPVDIVVKKSAPASGNKSDSLIFMEVEVTPKQTYVQAQIIYTVRIYHAVNLMDASLSEINVDDSDTIVEMLGNNASFDKQIDGRTYKVFEKKYALFPQKSGSIKVAPFIFETRFVGSRRNLKHRRLRTKAIDIKVLPKPTYVKGKLLAYWLPASSIKIAESWGDQIPKFKVGEPMTRTLRIIAQGLPASQLPNLHMESLDFAKLYPDQPVLTDNNDANGVSGTRIDKLAIIPTQSGKFTFPEIRVPWWNTIKNRWEHVVLQSRSVNIAPATDQLTSTMTPQPAVKSPSNIEPEQKPKVNGESTNDTIFGLGERFWFGLSILFLYLWLLTFIAWWYYSRRAKKMASLNKDNPAANQPIVTAKRLAVEKRLMSAGDRGEPDEIKRLLLEWGKAVFPHDSPYSLGALAKQCGGELEKEINDINKVIYSDKESAWNVSGLLKHIKKYQPSDVYDKQLDELEPMYFYVSEK